MQGVSSAICCFGDKLMALWMAREIGRRIFARFFGSGRYYEGSSARAIG